MSGTLSLQSIPKDSYINLTFKEENKRKQRLLRSKAVLAGKR